MLSGKDAGNLAFNIVKNSLLIGLSMFLWCMLIWIAEWAIPSTTEPIGKLITSLPGVIASKSQSTVAATMLLCYAWVTD